MNGEMLKFLSFRRGDENRPYPSGLASTRLNGTHPFPAPSLRELSSECETEGVSPDGSSTPTIYTPAHMNSETFERLRASNDTPSVSPCGLPAPSEREPGGLAPFIGVLAKIQRYGRFSSPLRNSEYFTAQSVTKKGGKEHEAAWETMATE